MEKFEPNQTQSKNITKNPHFFTTQTFGAITKPKQKSKLKPNKKQRELARQEKEDDVQIKPKSIEAVSAELLSFRTIREGMTILGCVKAINPTSIEVALPGRY